MRKMKRSKNNYKKGLRNFNSMSNQIKWAVVAFILTFLGACATSGGSPSVGPRNVEGGGGILADARASSASAYAPVSLTINISQFDPGIPSDPNQYEEKGVWPELRRTESVRFSLGVTRALEEASYFDRVKMSPDMSSSASFYVSGEILESNGEDVRIKVKVLDASGKTVLLKRFSHRVPEYALSDPRQRGADLYDPLFEKVARDIVSSVKRTNVRRMESLQSIEELSFAAAFAPDYFDRYLNVNSRGRTKLLGAPTNDDPMLLRVRSVRLKDQEFLDKLQENYTNFVRTTNQPYYVWQRSAFREAKAAREAEAARNARVLMGALAIGLAAGMASNADSYGDALGAGAVATVGAAALKSGIERGKDAKSHIGSLNELGRSLNTQLAPTVMTLEDEVVEFTGSAAEQYAQWQDYLRRVYVITKTPDVTL